MAWVAFFALVLWFPAVFFIFEKYAVPKAIVFSFITAWLFLPPSLIPLAGFPDWSKTTATVVSVTMCCWLKQPQRFFGFVPRWYDLPVALYCFLPFASAISSGSGAYDGLSAVLEELIHWGLPYLVGRAYLATPAGNRQLCLGIAVGGMLYAPLCLIEIRMSPQLKAWVYGFGGGRDVDFSLRYGGYRPMVFLSTGLELGWWMCCASLAAFMLYRSGTVRRLRGYPMWALTLVLGVVTVACKSTGALVQVSMAFLLIYGSRVLKTPVLVWALLAISPCYCINRPLGLWTGATVVSMAETVFGPDRAESLSFRFGSEEVLMWSAMQRPIFGWARSTGFNPPDASGKTAVTDGLWIIVFGTMGGAGLAMLNAMLLVPTILFLKRYKPKTWLEPDVAPLTTLAMILPLFMLDNLSNAMLNPIYAIAMGSLAGCLPRSAHTGPGAADQVGIEFEAGDDQSSRSPRPIGSGSPRDAAADRFEGEAAVAVEAGHQEAARALFGRAIQARQWALDAGPSPDRVDRLAVTHVAHARFLTRVGDLPAAIAERERALSLWRRLEDAEELAGRSLGAHAANLNDLAWRLIDGEAPVPDAVARAASLAEEALRAEPGQASFWNTLGIARYRLGDHYKAIHALGQAVARSPEGGNAFDFYYLALANLALGYGRPAAGWLERAEDWTRQHPGWESLLRPVRVEVDRAARPEQVT